MLLSLGFVLAGVDEKISLVIAVISFAAFLTLSKSSDKLSPKNFPQIPQLHAKEIEQIIKAVDQGRSLLVVSEQGSGKTTVAEAVAAGCSNEGIAIASYSGSIKPFLLSIADQLDIPITKPKFNAQGEEIGESPMNVDEMKAEIAINLKKKLLIIDDAHRLAISLKLWVEEIHKKGNQVLLFSSIDTGKGIFLRLAKIELSKPSELQIRNIMQHEAIALGLRLSPSRLASLQRRTGKNLMLAKKVIQDEALGINSSIEHRDYVDISPFIMAALAGVAIVRFLGLGMGDRTLYIIGGIAMMVGIMLKNFSRGISKNSKRRGVGL